MLSAMRLEYLEAEEVREQLLARAREAVGGGDAAAEEAKADSAAPQMSIIDVREDDLAPTKLNGATSHPAFRWNDDEYVDGVVQRHRNADVVVIHCAMSQQRGPACATRFLARLSAAAGDDNNNGDNSLPEVKVLRGGFTTFQRRYGGEKQLFETVSADEMAAMEGEDA